MKIELEKKLEIVKEKFKKALLDKKISVFEIIGYYTPERFEYMIFVFLKTDAEIKKISEDQIKEFRLLYISFLKEEQVYPRHIKWISGFYFNSDENVQTNYQGNYWLATL